MTPDKANANVLQTIVKPKELIKVLSAHTI